MNFFDKYNGGKRFTFELKGEPVFKKLSELYGEKGKGFVFPVRSIYINRKGKYGDSPVIVSDKFSVSLPTHRMSTVQDLLSQDIFYDMVNGGKVGFSVYEFESPTYGTNGYSINWVETDNWVESDLPF